MISASAMKSRKIPTVDDDHRDRRVAALRLARDGRVELVERQADVFGDAPLVLLGHDEVAERVRRLGGDEFGAGRRGGRADDGDDRQLRRPPNVSSPAGLRRATDGGDTVAVLEAADGASVASTISSDEAR